MATETHLVRENRACFHLRNWEQVLEHICDSLSESCREFVQYEMRVNFADDATVRDVMAKDAIRQGEERRWP